MSRAGESGRLKKHNCCLTCSIVCFILMIVFLVALYVGGTVLFKTYVSPHIGGLTLNDAISLAANVLSGKETPAEYTEADLDSFYSDLSSAMFLSDKSEDELEYELVPAESRATLAPAPSAAEDESSLSSQDPAYDEDAAYAAFLLKSKADRYALLSEESREKISLEEYSALAGDADAAVAARKKVGLKPYRISIESLVGDTDFFADDFSSDAMLDRALSSMEFNFDTLENYDIDNAAAEQNDKFTTFSVNGKQTSAFINDVLRYFLSLENSPLTSAFKDELSIQLNLTDYIKVASVTIMNTPLATANGEAIYDQKDTALGVSVSMNLRNLVKDALEEAPVKEKLSGVPSFAIGIIPSLVPKAFSVHATVYPLAKEEDGRELKIMVNKPSEKNAQRLSTLLNSLLAEKGEDVGKTFFGGLNDKVVEIFSSVNEKVKINFVPSKDKDGNPLKDAAGNTYSEMKIMTWDTVLSLIDKEGRLSAHDVFTMLKCVNITNNRPAELSLGTATAEFKSDISSKYGLSRSYLEDHNLLSTDDLNGLIDNVSLDSVDFTRDNAAMRVRLSAEALASYVTEILTKKADEEVSAAEEESSAKSFLEGLNLKVCGVNIDKITERAGVKVYSFELVISLNLADMLEDQIPDEGIGSTFMHKLLPKDDSYMGVRIYLSEYEEDGKILHKVGRNIDTPAEGQPTLYPSKIRVNDFTYEETDRVIDALNKLFDVVGSTSFDINNITGSLEEKVTEAFDAIAKNEFNLSLRLYEASGNSNGGITLPSIYELVRNLVKPKLAPDETFTEEDAQSVLSLLYSREVDMTAQYDSAQADSFLDDINDRFYIKKDAALSTADLFGDGASNLSSKIDANAIYFKPSAEEAAKWTGEKRALYSDDRAIEDLRVSLTGSRIAALVKDSNLIPDDLISTFGKVEVLGASFHTVDAKTYLTFDMKLLFAPGEGEDSLKYANIFPSQVKISATILLHAPTYPTESPRYASELIINDDDAEKVFFLLHALGGSDLTEKSISDKISESIATTFNTLEGKIPLFYTDGSAAYSVTEGGKTEECIRIADVFTFLVKETNMKDAIGDPTDPASLAECLRGFGEQASGDANNEGVYTWMSGLKLVTDTDDDYVYTNMQRAYFLKNKPSMDDVYNDFSSKFNTIKEDSFNLKDDSNGLFYYDGDIVNLKVSDRALALIVKEKQDLSGAVAGDGMTAEIMSLKIYHEDAKLVLESGIKIAFDNRSSYQMMPSYFFVVAKTKETGLGGYETTLSMNNLSYYQTNDLFANINSLADKGMNSSSFNKADIESTINNAITNALNKFPTSVVYGEFTSSDVSTEYNETNYPDDNIRVTAGDGYISFPSVYSYLIDMFYIADKPTEKAMQHMLNSLHAADADIENEIVTNPKDSGAYTVTIGSKGTGLYDAIQIHSDKYLAHAISTRIATETINGNLSLANGLDQIIILPALTASDPQGERDAWKNKFFSTGEYILGDNYVISTAVVNLSAYSSGSKTTLLPNNLWFTVLADLTTPSNSEGLLYNMNHSDMAIFEHILAQNNAQFNIKNIATEFATLIKNKLDEFSLTLGVNAQIDYKLSNEDYYYCESLPFSYNYSNLKNVADEWDDDGVGYIVLSLN